MYRIAILILLFTSIGVKADSLKVLYLGNSHTFWHDLPLLTANLALANGDTIIFEQNTPGGCTLAHPSNGHLFNPVSIALINSTDWDYVVLQEHSLFAVIDYYKNTYMYPGAKALDSLIKENNNCTKTIMQLIWGKKQGGQHCINTYCSVDFDDFSHMQDSLSTEYLRLGDTLSCIVAPTGVAWQQSIENGDPIELFDPDGSHPSLAGHYLTACVYYAIMFQKSPEGISYYGGLTQTEANYLQQIADQVVFSYPELWNLNGNIPEAGFELVQNENVIYCTDTSIGADSFSWDFGDGATDTIQNPSHSYSATGIYIVTQEVSKYCNTDIAIDTVDVILITAPEFLSKKDEIRFVYENKSGLVRIISNSEISGTINIYNISGQLLSSEKAIGKKEYSFKTDELQSGLYLISIQNKGKVTRKKILL